MVSIRRRRLLGLCSGIRNSFLCPLPRAFESGNAPENASRSSNPVSVHPMPMEDIKPPLDLFDQDTAPSGGIIPSNASESNQSKAQLIQKNTSISTSSKELNIQPTSEQELKRRKQHRRRRMNNQGQCVLRGVYFKNMKWQAAIKVDKKQIHLGTVSSQEEAARLYDRAAFMCGREPNFEVPEEEKQELRKFKWDEFLAMTRSAITSKRTRRRRGLGPSSVRPEWEGERGAEGFSGSDDAGEAATSPSEVLESGSTSFGVNF